MSAKRKHYIFDFGDVFINLDKQATTKELLKLGMTNFTPEMIEENYKYEKGLITTEEFLNFYKENFTNSSKEELKNAWNKIILDFPLYRLEFIEEFSKHNDCYLLSNINDMHLTFIQNQLGEEFYNRFLACFTKHYYSHEIHLRKPDNNIFEFLCKDSNLNPEECFFIDDTLENIEAARNLHIKSWHLIPDKHEIINLKKEI